MNNIYVNYLCPDSWPTGSHEQYIRQSSVSWILTYWESWTMCTLIICVLTPVLMGVMNNVYVNHLCPESWHTGESWTIYTSIICVLTPDLLGVMNNIYVNYLCPDSWPTGSHEQYIRQSSVSWLLTYWESWTIYTSIICVLTPDLLGVMNNIYVNYLCPDSWPTGSYEQCVR